MGRMIALKCLGAAGCKERPARSRAKRSFPEAHGHTSGCSDVEYLTFSELGVQQIWNPKKPAGLVLKGHKIFLATVGAGPNEGERTDAQQNLRNLVSAFDCTCRMLVSS